MKSNLFFKSTKINFYVFCLMFLWACNTNKAPQNIIERSKMINVLVDMHLADAVLAKVNNTDTMLMMASSKYYFIFKKYQIDSAKFTNSLKYYNNEPDEFKKMYAEVVGSLNAKIPKEKNDKKKIKRPLKKKVVLLLSDLVYLKSPYFISIISLNRVV